METKGKNWVEGGNIHKLCIGIMTYTKLDLSESCDLMWFFVFWWDVIFRDVKLMTCDVSWCHQQRLISYFCIDFLWFLHLQLIFYLVYAITHTYVTMPRGSNRKRSNVSGGQTDTRPTDVSARYHAYENQTHMISKFLHVMHIIL